MENTENQEDVKQVVRPISFGKQLVGLTFNPSGDEKVNKAKELCAELADLLNDHYMSKESSQLEQTLFKHTIGEILNAQMNVVKVLTLKY
jgi:hypothetical protein